MGREQSDLCSVTSPKQGTQSQERFVGLKRATKGANPAGCKLLGKVINGM